jgi:hypothetical protein
MKTPNKKTIKSFKEYENKKVEKFDNFDDFWKNLNCKKQNEDLKSKK